MATLPDVEGLREKIEVAPGFCCRGPTVCVGVGVPCLEFPGIGFPSISNLDLQSLAQCIPLWQRGQILQSFLLAFLGQSPFIWFLSLYAEHPSFPFLKVVAIVSASICIF